MELMCPVLKLRSKNVVDQTVSSRWQLNSKTNKVNLLLLVIKSRSIR